MPAILLINNDTLLRRGLRQILTEEFRGSSFSDASSAEEALFQVRKRAWDLVILDISSIDHPSLQIVEDILRIRPGGRVLVVESKADGERANRIFRFGALGYISKSISRSELVKAVGAVLSARKYMTPSVPSRVTSKEVGHRRRRADTLSQREYRVMLAIAVGRRTGEIAKDLQLSIKTVSTYKHRIMQKLGLKTTVDIVRYVIEHQLS